MKIAVIFDNFGPYHVARLNAAAPVSTLLAIQVNARSREYEWASFSQQQSFASVTLDGGRQGTPPPGLSAVLTGFAPECVFVPGWSRTYSLIALAWCRANGVPAVLMSESAEIDKPRRKWTECLKRKLVSLFSAALVGGSAHADYLGKLGMSRQQIQTGYDVVDNDYFAQASARVRALEGTFRVKYGLQDQFFLASARFIERKNLKGLIQAYVRYRAGSTDAPWNLVLLGDGPLRDCLGQLISESRLGSFVRLAGFVQYPELPIYYGLAQAFIHASFSEPWGLVVNEAMASGLPVIVSNRCGCARDLVKRSNGFTFDPANTKELSDLMLRMLKDRRQLEGMGKASFETVSSWGPQRFARGFLAAAQTARKRFLEGNRSISDAVFRLVLGS